MGPQLSRQTGEPAFEGLGVGIGVHEDQVAPHGQTRGVEPGTFGVDYQALQATHAVDTAFGTNAYWLTLGRDHWGGDTPHDFGAGTAA